MAVAFVAVYIGMLTSWLPLQGAELRVDMTLSAPGGSFEVYANQDFAKAYRIEATRAGRHVYTFAGLPGSLSTIRLNPIDKAEIEITLHAVEILIGRENKVRLQVESFRTHYLRKSETAGRFVSAGGDPTFVSELTGDAAAALDTARRGDALQNALLAALFTAAATAGLLYARAYRRLRVVPAVERGGHSGSAVRGAGTFDGLGETAFRYRYLFILAVIGLAAAVSAFLLNTYRSIALFTPSYEMVVEAKISPLFGVGALYVNQNWNSPKKNSNAQRDGLYVFEYLPSRISHLRLDLPTDTGSQVEIVSIQIRTSDRYRPHPGQTLLSLNTPELALWQLYTGQWHEKGRRFTAGKRMIELHRARALDLDSMLPAPPAVPLSLKVRFWAGLSVLGLILASGLVFLVVVGKRAPSLIRQIAILSVAGGGWLLSLLSAFPAHWTWDQFYTLNELFAGTLSDLHPPLSVLSWVFTMEIARLIGFEKLGQIAFLLVLQLSLFWAAAVYVASQFRHTALSIAMLLAIALTPSTLSLLGDIGKDGQLMIAMFLAAVLIYRADKEASPLTLCLAVPVLFYAFAMRTNAPAPAFPLCLYAGFVFVRILKQRLDSDGLLSRQIYFLVVSGVTAAALFGSIFGGTVLVYKASVQKPCCLGAPGAATAIHDLIGLTARTEKTLLPDYVLRDRKDGRALIAKRYWDAAGSVDFTGLETILPADQQSDLVRYWLRQIVEHPAAYWEHRVWVNKYYFNFTQEPTRLTFFVGTATPEYPWVTPRSRELFAGLGDIPAQMTHLKTAIAGYLYALEHSGLMRLWVYAVVFLCALAFLPARFENPLNRFSWAVALSVVCHVAPLVLLTSSGSSRYSSWPFLAVIVILFTRLDLSASPAAASAQRPAIAVAADRLRRFPLGQRIPAAVNFALWTAGVLGLGYWLSSLVPIG